MLYLLWKYVFFSIFTLPCEIVRYDFTWIVLDGRSRVQKIWYPSRDGESSQCVRGRRALTDGLCEARRDGSAESARFAAQLGGWERGDWKHGGRSAWWLIVVVMCASALSLPSSVVGRSSMHLNCSCSRIWKGCQYARHIDDGISTSGRPMRRSISLIVYLTPDDWAPCDGGELRVHPVSDAEGGGEPFDISALAGSLILFDGASTPHACPHEVRRPSRKRIAVCDWFLEARS